MFDLAAIAEVQYLEEDVFGTTLTCTLGVAYISASDPILISTQ